MSGSSFQSPSSGCGSRVGTVVAVENDRRFPRSRVESRRRFPQIRQTPQPDPCPWEIGAEHLHPVARDSRFNRHPTLFGSPSDYHPPFSVGAFFRAKQNFLIFFAH